MVDDETPESAVNETFVSFYQRSYARSVRLAILLGASRVEADDIAQDAFAKIFSRWDKIRSPDHYLDAAIRNGTRSVLRRRGRGTVVADIDSVEPAVAWAGVVDVDMARAIAALPIRWREVVVLRFFLDRSEQEIAVLIGRPAGTVKSRLSRALADLTRSVDCG